MVNVNPQQYLANADLLYTEQDVLNAIEAVASSITTDCADDFPVVLSVMNGALVFAGRLVTCLNFPLQLDYIHALMYEGGLEGKEIAWLAKPAISLKNRNVLILDDILDKGITLQAIVKDCYLNGAKQVKTAVLVEKALEELKPLQADYVGLTVPDRYVFGCGMDVHGFWRNLPEIYALNAT